MDWMENITRTNRKATRRRFVLERCRYSSFEKFKDAFDTALGATLPLCKQSRRMRHFRSFFKPRQMPTGSSSWRHIRYGFRQCRHRCPCKPGWFLLEQWSNYSTLCPVEPVLRTFVQYLITFCSRPEAASDVISGTFARPIGLDKCVKFRGSSSNRSLEIPPEAVWGDIFEFFSL